MRARARAGGLHLPARSASTDQPHPSAKARKPSEPSAKEASSAPTSSSCRTNAGSSSALRAQTTPGRTDQPHASPHLRQARKPAPVARAWLAYGASIALAGYNLGRFAGPWTAPSTGTARLETLVAPAPAASANRTGSAAFHAAKPRAPTISAPSAPTKAQVEHLDLLTASRRATAQVSEHLAHFRPC